MSGQVSSALVKPKPRRVERARALVPDIWALVGPRKWILLLGMVLIAIQRLANLVQPYATKYLVDGVLIHGRRDLLPKIIGAVAAATVVQAFVLYAMTQIFSRSTAHLIAELRCKLHAHVMRLSLLYHDRNKSGALGSRVMNDVQGLQNLVGPGFLGYIGNLMTSAIALVLMAREHLIIAAIAFVGVFVFGAVFAFGTSKQRAIAVERSKILADIYGRLTETLGGVRVVKAYRAEERERAVFAAGMKRVVDNQFHGVDLAARLGFATSLLWGSVGLVMMWVGASLVLSDESSPNHITPGAFFEISVLLGLMISPLIQIVGMGTMVMEALAGLERTRDILHEPAEDDDPGRTVVATALAGEVVFEDVQFSYAPGKPVLKDFSFHAAPGTVTALVGPSGSGKSTTIGLIASFYRPTEGRVLVDGADINTLELASYRSQLGVVLQETFLFAGTILENVAFARPGATRDEILAACRIARVDEFAEKFERGYDTPIGERGVLLSGGQRQRISIARALLADPRILILDEATSSLDTHSEALIQEALAYLLEGRTTFVIAHRLSTIRAADQILVVDEGRVVERGTHDALCAARGRYFEMYSKQHRVEADLFLAPGEGEAPAATNRPALPAAMAEDPSGGLGIPL
jgi:ABC-type multidrug transport system fused ATPase/permease subunit